MGAVTNTVSDIGNFFGAAISAPFQLFNPQKPSVQETPKTITPQFAPVKYAEDINTSKKKITRFGLASTMKRRASLSNPSLVMGAGSPGGKSLLGQ
jgi:hypothetical protein